MAAFAPDSSVGSAAPSVRGGAPGPLSRLAKALFAGLARVHARLTIMPPGIPERHRDIFAMTHYTYWCGLIAHCVFLVVFARLGLTGLAVFNCASILVFTGTLVLSRRGFLQTALFIGGLEVTLHQVYATLTLGLDAGFHFYLLILSFATLLYTHLPVVQRLAMAVAPILLYLGLYAFSVYHPPTVVIDALPLSLFGVGNLLAFSIILTGICFYFVDTANKARIEAERQARAKTLFLANMSHELRTPLNAILGFTQIVARSPALTAQDRGNLATIDRSGEHLLGLINNVLDMAKVEDGKLALAEATVDLPAFLDDLARMFAVAAANRRLAFVTELDPGLPRGVRADELKLRQVLINLLNNAIKFTDSGGVTLAVRVAPSARDGGRRRIRFSVTDTGPGLAPEELAQLFQLFTQTAAGRRSGGGTGLGLALSQRLVSLMGGRIEVASAPGRGATFAFAIELDEVAAPEPRPVETGGVLAPGQRPFRLLVVDDNEENRHVLIQMFGRMGFEVEVATGGEDGVERWRDRAPDLTWMDLQMPGVDGYEATRRIKALVSEVGRTAPVVALTASSLPGDRERALAAGCDDFLTKPFRVADLVAVLARHLGARFVPDTGRVVAGGSAASPVGSSGDTSADWRARVAALSSARRVALSAAAAALDLDAAERVLAEIAADDPALAGELRALVAAYRFDTLAELLGP